MTISDFKILNNVDKRPNMLKLFDHFDIQNDDPYADYDARVQEVLDEYWPGFTDLTAMRRRVDHTVYSIMQNEIEYVVKSSDYKEHTEQVEQNHMKFVNYLGQNISVAEYIEPGVVHSNDQTLLVTVSEFMHGENPKDLQPDAPYTWVFDENVAKEIGSYWSDFRSQSIAFK